MATIGGVAVKIGCRGALTQAPCVGEVVGGCGSCAGVRLPNYGGKGGVCLGSGVVDGMGSSMIGDREWVGSGGGVVNWAAFVVGVANGVLDCDSGGTREASDETFAMKAVILDISPWSAWMALTDSDWWRSRRRPIRSTSHDK